VIELIADQAGEVPIVIASRDHQGVKPVALHEGARPLIALTVFTLGKRGIHLEPPLNFRSRVYISFSQ
jgi:hypothetical protein